MTKSERVFFLLLLCLFFLSCSRGPEMGEVEGTVTYNGQPLGGIEVQFLPDPAFGTRGPASSAVTDPQGHFTLMCDNRRPGAVIGKHQVRMRDLLAEAPRRRPAAKQPADDDDDRTVSSKSRSRIPPHYANPSQNPMYREVAPGAQTIHLELKGPAMRGGGRS